jgi:hypothetical protein
MAVTGPLQDPAYYLCLSTDTKPTSADDVNPGDEIYETDTGKTYIYSGSAWIRK